ncbi:uncharacterized protein AB675_65 [Cyphellophora attinorum]|uniref:Transcription factor tau 55 kDa subunit n=1 Tax=Cyphellophora attinorum TaxID=1664694 RepID=A0A0N1GX30_9EURO|nr:uncharacterized protein AB675_65 [Phialophora attinorum]KPI34693.1 hypothetical protein AB675_65 [Phialophora attinorum]
MPVSTILLLRHGHRLAWSLDPNTGEYSSSHPFPTRLPADPPLASHGVSQAKETGSFLSKELFKLAQEQRLVIYSSLFYRCLETLRPTVECLLEALDDNDRGKGRKSLQVRGERGLGEWFGHAWFEQPAPAEPRFLKEKFFPWVDDTYQSLVIPDRHGERIEDLHERIKRALKAVVDDVDREYAEAGREREEVTMLICGHAAQIIASGRALTGWKLEEREDGEGYDEDDFQCFTCGISRFERKNEKVLGGFDCTSNSDCSHLSQGEERGWKFHGDESFDSYGAAQSKGVKVSDGSFGDGSKL